MTTFRQAAPGDEAPTEQLTREAFWNLFVPGCNEHFLLHLLRQDAAGIPALDWVAEAEGEILGSIVYSQAQILGDEGETHPVLTFGPVAVRPAHQGQGIGRELIARSLEKARALGHLAVLIYGDPGYYSRLGFLPAERFDIRTSDNVYADALQALELRPGALTHCPGRFQEAAVFEVDKASADIFDRQFPPREKKSGLASQARFMEIASRRRARGM